MFGASAIDEREYHTYGMLLCVLLALIACYMYFFLLAYRRRTYRHLWYRPLRLLYMGATELTLRLLRLLNTKQTSFTISYHDRNCYWNKGTPQINTRAFIAKWKRQTKKKKKKKKKKKISLTITSLWYKYSTTWTGTRLWGAARSSSSFVQGAWSPSGCVSGPWDFGSACCCCWD